MNGVVKPPILQIGDTVGVVAPAGKVDAAGLESGVDRLRDMGFRVRVGSSVHEVYRGMAGEDRSRARDLLRMFSDPEVKAVLCARGGYGSARLIPFLDRELIRKNPKVFVGCSDVTILLLYLTQVCGLLSFHGPMVAPHFGSPDSRLTQEQFLKVLTQPDAGARLPLPGVRVLRSGRAEGCLMGGCLSILCSAIGTPYDFHTDDTILFLEDVSEPFYRIDRMLTQLKHTGRLLKVRGVLIGEMPDCHPAHEEGRLEDIILEVLDDFEGPVLLGVPSGHGPQCLTLPLGIQARVTASDTPGDGSADQVSLSLLESSTSASGGDDVVGGSL